jgi:Prp8 binding protein
MQLTGHEGEIYSGKFSPSGATLATASFDRKIFLWNVFGECENFGVLQGHTGAVLELAYSADGSLLFTAATDKTGGIWDIETGTRRRKLKEHTSIVNSCCSTGRGVQHVVTGSDDGTVKLWDTRHKSSVQTFQNTYQVTAVAFGDNTQQIFSGGLDNDIKVWDLRKNELLYILRGHLDTVTGLAVSADGSYLLSNSMDNTVRIWDIRPFAPVERQLKSLDGSQHGFEKNLIKCCWSPDGSLVAAGSADRFVYVWDTVNRRIMYKLPGHKGSVNGVHFHPQEPILVSVSSDKTVFLGEL